MALGKSGTTVICPRVFLLKSLWEDEITVIFPEFSHMSHFGKTRL